jgi:hypothetical protein
MTEITITFERDVAPRERDFKVLINGEHRATFRSRRRFSQSGYDLHTPYGGDCGAYDLRHIESIQANFETIVRKALPKIPTRAQIERVLLVEQAWKENHERDNQIAAHRAQVRREVLHSALKRYLELGARDGEHHRMAERMLQEMDR